MLNPPWLSSERDYLLPYWYVGDGYSTPPSPTYGVPSILYEGSVGTLSSDKINRLASSSYLINGRGQLGGVADLPDFIKAYDNVNAYTYNTTYGRLCHYVKVTGINGIPSESGKISSSLSVISSVEESTISTSAGRDYKVSISNYVRDNFKLMDVQVKGYSAEKSFYGDISDCKLEYYKSALSSLYNSMVSAFNMRLSGTVISKGIKGTVDWSGGTIRYGVSISMLSYDKNDSYPYLLEAGVSNMHEEHSLGNISLSGYVNCDCRVDYYDGVSDGTVSASHTLVKQKVNAYGSTVKMVPIVKTFYCAVGGKYKLRLSDIEQTAGSDLAVATIRVYKLNEHFPDVFSSAKKVMPSVVSSSVCLATVHGNYVEGTEDKYGNGEYEPREKEIEQEVSLVGGTFYVAMVTNLNVYVYQKYFEISNGSSGGYYIRKTGGRDVGISAKVSLTYIGST